MFRFVEIFLLLTFPLQHTLNLSIRYGYLSTTESDDDDLCVYNSILWKTIFSVSNSPDSQIDDDDLVSSYEFVLDMVEVEHSDTDRLLQSASLYEISCSQRHFKNICFLVNCSNCSA
jgi:hypothetical protein